MLQHKSHPPRGPKRSRCAVVGLKIALAVTSVSLLIYVILLSSQSLHPVLSSAKQIAFVHEDDNVPTMMDRTESDRHHQKKHQHRSKSKPKSRSRSMSRSIMSNDRIEMKERRLDRNKNVTDASTKRVKDPGIVKSHRYTLSLKNLIIPEYLPDYKNPCYLEKTKKSIVRCLPYVYLAGFPKCGTTDLYSLLVSHPLVFPPIMKEPHFFTQKYHSMEPKEFRKCPGDVDCSTYHYSKMFFYLASTAISQSNTVSRLLARSLYQEKPGKYSDIHFNFVESFLNESIAVVKKAQRKHKYPAITLDSSASTAWDNAFWMTYAENKGLKAPTYLTIDWLSRLTPNAKFILILRNPVTRLFSDYLYFANTSATAYDFHRRVEKTIDRLDNCLEKEMHVLCFHPDLNTTASELRLHVGLYHYHVKALYERVPRENIYILKFEDYTRDRLNAIKKIYNFLDLPPLSNAGLKHITAMSEKNKLPLDRSIGKMMPRTRRMLYRFYQTHNEKLAKFLNDTAYLWKV